ncbi:MAG: hypothetical protein OWS03_11315 [Alicyclobacillaceae bacterium]|nr:hypothetical protein [Alicyclobacillaceae bacterium]
MQEPKKRPERPRRPVARGERVVDLKSFRSRRRAAEWRQSHVNLQAILFFCAYTLGALSLIFVGIGYLSQKFAPSSMVVAMFLATVGFVPALALAAMRNPRATKPLGVLAVCLLVAYVASLTKTGFF